MLDWSKTDIYASWSFIVLAILSFILLVLVCTAIVKFLDTKTEVNVLIFIGVMLIISFLIKDNVDVFSEKCYSMCIEKNNVNSIDKCEIKREYEKNPEEFEKFVNSMCNK